MIFAGRTRFRALSVAGALALVPATLLCGLGPVGATWPGRNGDIVHDRGVGDRVQIFKMAPDGSGGVQLTSLGNNVDPSWSPNGRVVAFDGDRTGVSQLFRMGADGTNQRNISPDGNCAAYPSWAPDGRSLVFVHYPDPQCTGAPDVWTAQGDGSRPRALTNTPNEREVMPSYSPDGSRIAFASHTSAPGTFAVYTIRANGSDRRRVTPTRQNASGPDWSPDGRRLVVSSGADESEQSLYTIDPDGRHLQRLTRPAPDVVNAQPRWSPDERFVLFSSNRYGDQFDLFTIRLRDGVVRKRTRTAVNELTSSWQATDR